MWFVYEDGPKTYHEILNRAQKCIGTKEMNSDYAERKAKSYDLAWTKDKNI